MRPLEFYPEKPEPSDIGQRALEAGKLGVVGGAGLGLMRELLSDEPSYLRGTLGGALLGGLGAGSLAAYQTADPFQRGSVPGQAYQSALQTALMKTVGGADLPETAQSAMQSALTSVLTGRGRFTPEEQQSLIQQFTQSVLPTKGGWEKRIKLANKVADQLAGDRPMQAMRGLQLMADVMPDLDIKTAAQHALERLRGGRYRKGEERAALAALGTRIKQRLGEYETTVPALDELRKMKEEYAAGKLTPEDFAKRVGILTGRFGPATEEAERMRRFLQGVIARPVSLEGAPDRISRLYQRSPVHGELVEKALGG